MEVMDPKPASGAVENASPAIPATPAASQTSAATAPQPEQVKPDNFLPWAIVSTILCCLPFGIVAIVYASQVDGYWFAGNYEAARRSARNARTWTWVSVGVAAVCWLIYLICVVVFAAAFSLPFANY